MKKILSILLVLVLSFAMFACGSTGTPDVDAPDPEGPDGLEENVVTVSSVEEFMAAVGNNVIIQVEPGYYNFSDYLENIFYENGSEWDAEHENMHMEEVWDGVAFVIENISNMTIEGTGDTITDTEFVIEPRYANVFTFSYCDSIMLNNICVGHTETGSCVGDVIYLDNCSNVQLNNCDFYGCGVNGVTAMGCYNVSANNTYIHDCSWCALVMETCSGDLEFTDCTFTDNYWGLSQFDNMSTVIFNNCVFGQEESNCVAFAENIELNDCDVMEPTEYPEY